MRAATKILKEEGFYKHKVKCHVVGVDPAHNTGMWRVFMEG